MTDNQKHQFPWNFFALTFGFSWLVWLPAILTNLNIIPLPSERIAGPLFFVGVFGPLFGACVLTYRSEGGTGLKRYLARLLDFRVGITWWVVIVLLPPSIQAVAHFSPLLTNELVPSTFISSPWMFFVIFLMVTLLGGGQEEPGWRGYALDRIQSRFNALTSSIILGTFWACWHIPLWFMPGTSQPYTPFGAFLVVCIALSVILTWIYNNTAKSIVAVIMTHGMVNAAHPLFPVLMPAGADQHLYVYWAMTCAVAATVITLVWGPATLAGRTSREKLMGRME